MPITQNQIDQAYSELHLKCGGVSQDYFGLLYLEREFKLSREDAIPQNAFGGHDYGIDGFHIDATLRNLYLFQFKWTTSPATFKGSFERLINFGMERVFGNVQQDQQLNQMLLQLKGKLLEYQSAIDRVFFHFVFNGDPAEAERSQVLDKLREDLEGKRYLMDSFFERPVNMAVQYRSASRQVGSTVRRRMTHTHPVDIDETLQSTGPDGEIMHVGFVRLADLHNIYVGMGPLFFERNIRYGLSETHAPNRAITRALKDIVLDGSQDPSVFAFDHNGVTIYAEKLEQQDGQYKVVEPRLLNGAQTVTTFARFMKKNENNPRLKERKDAIRDLRVLCKFITSASPKFVTAVTINNNRQNPVMPWDLHANDMIQLQLHDRFVLECGIYYQRQENAFANLTQEDLDELDISEYKAVEMRRLAQTFLASDGEIDKMSNMQDVFGNEKSYDAVFNDSRLKLDLRYVILCYKAQFRLRRLIREILERGEKKYAYMVRARNLVWALLCQAILNEPNLENYAHRYGTNMIVDANYTEWLAALSSTKVRFLIRDVAKEPTYAVKIAEENYDFLRTNIVYDKCLTMARERWHWAPKRLK